MSIVRLQASMVVGLYPQSGVNLALSLDMSHEQRKTAIVALLGGLPEQDAYEWLRSEFPQWFAKVPA